MAESDMDQPAWPCEISRHSTAVSSAPSSVPRLRILLSAYACEPDRGSEAALDWNWAKQAARHHNVWGISRSSNRRSIQAQLTVDPRMANVLDWLAGSVSIRPAAASRLPPAIRSRRSAIWRTLRVFAENPRRPLGLFAGACRTMSARCDQDNKGEFVYGECACQLGRPRSDAA